MKTLIILSIFSLYCGEAFSKQQKPVSSIDKRKPASQEIIHSTSDSVAYKIRFESIEERQAIHIKEAREVNAQEEANFRSIMSDMLRK